MAAREHPSAGGRADAPGGRPWWIEPWIDAVSRPAEMVPLDRAAALLSAHGLRGSLAAAGPGVVENTVARLDGMARACPAPTFEALHALLFGVMGFQGERGDYHAPRNSFLPVVLTRRRGIPISLAVVVMEVGRRIGIPIAGVGMPGHFLTAYESPEGTRWIDAFDGGTVLDLDGVSKLYGSMFAGGQAFDPAVLLPEVDTHAVLVRMLNNLKSVSTFSRDLTALADVVWLRQALPGPTVQDRQEHVRLCLAVGRFDEARAAIGALAGVLGADDPTVLDDQRRLAALLS